MKKVLFLTLFAALLLLSACQKTEEPIPGEYLLPPSMIVTVAEDSVERQSSPFRWTRGGQVTAVSPATPAEWVPREPHLKTAGQTATLTFALPPDEVGVTCREATTGDSGTCQLDENGALVLADGCWVYVVMAQWIDESRPYHGWASYTVCIEKK